MSKLVNFDEDKNEHNIHHGGVKLETNVAGAGVEYCTEDALENQADAHTIEQTELLQQSSCSKVIIIGLIFLGKKLCLQSDKHHKDNSIDDVTNIADDVVKVIKHSIRS